MPRNSLYVAAYQANQRAHLRAKDRHHKPGKSSLDGQRNLHEGYLVGSASPVSAYRDRQIYAGAGRPSGNISDIEALKLFGEEAFVNETGKPQEMQSAPASFVQLLKRRLARNPYLLEIYRKRIHSRRALALKGYEDHIYHGPNYYLPPFGGRSVVTIHDLSVFTMPEHHPKERVSFLRKEVEFALTQASMLITDAEFTRREVADHFGWPLDKIGVATLAGGQDFSPRGEGITGARLKQYGLQPGQYALYAGTIEPARTLNGF